MAPEFEPDARLTDPVKIAASIAGKREKWIEKAALSPVTGRIVAVGILQEDGQQQLHIDMEDEGGLLMYFWRYYLANLTTDMVGFNCKNFDLRFIYLRCIALDVPIPATFRPSRYFDDRFIDLMEEYQCGDRTEYISLDMLARWLGVGSKSGDGAMFYKMNRPDQEKYLAQDLNLTLQCALRMLPGRSRSV
jgi:hypothetical protein